MNVNLPGVPLQPPVDLSTLSNQGSSLLHTVQTQSNSLYKDLLDSSKNDGQSSIQKFIDNINSGEPGLVPPKDPPPGNSQEIKGNPWLDANPLATFTICFLDLARTLSKLKLVEAKMSADTILNMAAVTKETAQLILDLGKLEAIGHFISAGMSLMSGAISFTGGLMAQRGNPNAGQIQARMAMVTGLTQLPNAVDGVAKGIIAIQKSSLEAIKLFAENEKQLLQDQLGKLSEAYKSAADQMDQILQTLTKYYDESYRAHGWQTH